MIARPEQHTIQCALELHKSMKIHTITTQNDNLKILNTTKVGPQLWSNLESELSAVPDYQIHHNWSWTSIEGFCALLSNLELQKSHPRKLEVCEPLRLLRKSRK